MNVVKLILWGLGSIFCGAILGASAVLWYLKRVFSKEI